MLTLEHEETTVFASKLDAETEWLTRKGLIKALPLPEVTRVLQQAYIDREIIRVNGGWIVVIKEHVDE